MPRPPFLRRTALATAVLALGACSSATEPPDVPNLSILLGPTADPYSGTPSATVSGNDVVFRGEMAAPCLQYDIVPDAKRTADGYVITLRGTQKPGGCSMAIGRNPYTGTLWDLPSGNPRVIVRHVITDANWPADTVIDTRVVIP